MNWSTNLKMSVLMLAIGASILGLGIARIVLKAKFAWALDIIFGAFPLNRHT